MKKKPNSKLSYHFWLLMHFNSIHKQAKLQRFDQLFLVVAAVVVVLYSINLYFILNLFMEFKLYTVSRTLNSIYHMDFCIASNEIYTPHKTALQQQQQQQLMFNIQCMRERLKNIANVNETANNHNNNNNRVCFESKCLWLCEYIYLLGVLLLPLCYVGHVIYDQKMLSVRVYHTTGILRARWSFPFTFLFSCALNV